MKIYAAGSDRLIGQSTLQVPTTPYLVIRLLDDAGEYRRLKFPVVERNGERVIETDDPAKAVLLPGFQGDVAKIAAKVEVKSPVLHHVHEERSQSYITTMLTTKSGLEAEILVRLLEKLGEYPLIAAAEVELTPGVCQHVVLPLPDRPQGYLFWKPAAGIPTPMRIVMDRVALEEHSNSVVLELECSTSWTLAKGASLGVLEVRSRTALPEGMREKVFQSLWESALNAR